MSDKLYSKYWQVGNNGEKRYFKDEVAEQDINTLKGNSSTVGSIDYKIAQAISDKVSNTDYATQNTAGLVKPDNSTITVDGNGVISAVGGGSVDIDNDSITLNQQGQIQAVKVAGTLGVSNGGTGATTFAAGQVLVGNGASALSTKAIDTSVTENSSNLVTSGAVYNAVKVYSTLVSWSSASDTQIANIIADYYAGDLSLDAIKSVWKVGDTRKITLSAMAATGIGESHRSQEVEMVIIGFNHDTLTTAINGKTKALLTVQLKDCLRDAAVADNDGRNNTENGYMNSTKTNVGGWKSCARRTWCNNVFYNALPLNVKSLVKQVDKYSGVGGSSSSDVEVTSDYIWLPSDSEICGYDAAWSYFDEGDQYSYFSTAKVNRYKKPIWSSSSSAVSCCYWLRSPKWLDDEQFIYVDYYYNSSAGLGDDANTAYGISPAWCM